MEQERHTGEMISIEDHELAMAALRAENERVQYAATHDDLTGLINSREFIRLASQQKVDGKPFGIISMDLDDFRAVNNISGDHEVGNTVLRALGAHLSHNFSRDQDAIAARMGGDEIAILAGLSDDTGRRRGHPYDRMDNMCTHLDDTMSVFPDIVRTLDGVPPEVKALSFGFSRGAAVYLPTDEPITLGQLLTIADARMYVHKMMQVPVRTPEEAARLREYERGLEEMKISLYGLPKAIAALNWRARSTGDTTNLKDPAALRAA